jgi:hypothetical protein
MDEDGRLREIALAARRRPGTKIQLEIKPDKPEEWEIVLVTLQNVADTLKRFGQASLRIMDDQR